jgi:hypothetical protein
VAVAPAFRTAARIAADAPMKLSADGGAVISGVSLPAKTISS